MDQVKTTIQGTPYTNYEGFSRQPFTTGSLQSNAQSTGIISGTARQEECTIERLNTYKQIVEQLLKALGANIDESRRITGATQIDDPTQLVHFLRDKQLFTPEEFNQLASIHRVEGLSSLTTGQHTSGSNYNNQFGSSGANLTGGSSAKTDSFTLESIQSITQPFLFEYLSGCRRLASPEVIESLQQEYQKSKQQITPAKLLEIARRKEQHHPTVRICEAFLQIQDNSNTRNNGAQVQKDSYDELVNELEKERRENGLRLKNSIKLTDTLLYQVRKLSGLSTNAAVSEDTVSGCFEIYEGRLKDLETQKRSLDLENKELKSLKSQNEYQLTKTQDELTSRKEELGLKEKELQRTRVKIGELVSRFVGEKNASRSTGSGDVLQELNSIELVLSQGGAGFDQTFEVVSGGDKASFKSETKDVKVKSGSPASNDEALQKAINENRHLAERVQAYAQEIEGLKSREERLVQDLSSKTKSENNMSIALGNLQKDWEAKEKDFLKQIQNKQNSNQREKEQLEQQKKSLDEQKLVLNNQTISLDSQRANLEQRARDVESREQQIKNSNFDYSQKEKELGNTINELRAKENNSNIAVANLKQEIYNFGIKVQQLGDELTNEKKINKNLEENLAKEVKEVGELKAEVERIAQEKVVLIKKSQNAEDEVRNLREDLLDKEKKLLHEYHLKETRDQKNHAQAVTLQDLNDQNNRLIREDKELRAKIGSLEEKVLSLEGNNSELKTTLNFEKAQHSDYKGKLEIALSKVAQLEEELDSSSLKLKDSSVHKIKAEQEEKEKINLNDTIRSMEEKLLNSEHFSSENTKKSNAVIQQLKEKLQDFDHLKQENEELHKQNKKFAEELEEAENLVSENQQLKEEIQNLSEYLNENQNNAPELESLRNENQELQKELEQYVEALNVAKEIEDEKNELLEKVTNLQQDNEMMAQALEEINEKIESGEIKLMNLEGEEEMNDEEEEQDGNSNNQVRIQERDQKKTGQAVRGIQRPSNESDSEALNDMNQSDLLKVTKTELRNLKNSYEELSERFEQLAQEYDVVSSERDELKDRLIAILNEHEEGLEEGQREGAEEGQQEDGQMEDGEEQGVNLGDEEMEEDGRNVDQIIDENEQLVDILRQLAEEINELRSMYMDTISDLFTKNQERDAKGISYNDFVVSAQEMQNIVKESKDDRGTENMRDFNRGLRESVEYYESEKQKLGKRIETLQGWCKDDEMGLAPMTDRGGEEEGTEEQAGEGQEGDFQGEQGYEEEGGENQEEFQGQPEQGEETDEELSTDKLVELLLITLQLIENIRETAADTSAAEVERLESIVGSINKFEMMGDSGEGNFELATILQKMVDNKVENEQGDSGRSGAVEQDGELAQREQDGDEEGYSDEEDRVGFGVTVGAAGRRRGRGGGLPDAEGELRQGVLDPGGEGRAGRPLVTSEHLLQGRAGERGEAAGDARREGRVGRGRHPE
jgi:chromosome segregation ATPase